jgi:predicted ATPase
MLKNPIGKQKRLNFVANTEKIMSKIRVKHFGPIKEGYQQEDGWLDINKVTVFIGNQGTGKSTIAKLVSTFTWIEKALVRGDYDKKEFERKGRLRNRFLAYHRIENYFTGQDDLPKTQIEYNGDAYNIKFENESWSITEVTGKDYPLPQIIYIPAERNFISNIKDANLLRLTSDSLLEFLTEFNNAKNEIKDSIELPVNNASVEYDKLNDIINIKGLDYKIRLYEASSGFQSIVPLFLVSWNLANSVLIQPEFNSRNMNSKESETFRKNLIGIIDSKDLTFEQKRVAISALSSKFTKKAFINIVEEPEQNLFPKSQWEILKTLLNFNNKSEGNKLIITTHSPYIINYLSLAIQANYLKNKIDSKSLLKKLDNIVSLSSTVSASDVSIYQLNENGIITKLPNYEGIPSDSNFLNEILREGNHLFDSLLEIEEEFNYGLF